MIRGTFLFLLIMSAGFVAAEGTCDLDVTLLNQDPYPAVPGDYVKLVFQLEGIQDPDCNDITFVLLEDYPISLDPGKTGIKTFRKIDYIKDYESNLLIPYEVRVDPNALDGSNPIEVRAQSRNSASLSKTFDMEVDDVRADFEVYVKDYDYATRELTLEILNIEASDVEALSVEIPKQDSITVKGANKVVVGDLDSNEYTTADFEATPSDGEFTIVLTYSDAINERRTLEKALIFDSSYFTGRVGDEKSTSSTSYIVIGAIVLFVVYLGYKRIKKKKKR